MSQKSASHIDKLIGSRMRQRRLAMGMSQAELAKGLGITFQQIQKYERGDNRIGAGRLFDIARILEVSTAFFFEQSGLEALGSTMSEANAFATSREGVELAQAFMAIGNPDVRRAFVNLAKAAAEDAQATPERE